MYSLLLTSVLALGLHANGHHARAQHPRAHPAKHTSAMHLPFYRITHSGSRDTSYIFGTLHLLEGSYVDTLPHVIAALRRSDMVIGELSMDSAMTGDALAGLFDAPPLDSLVASPEYDEIRDAVKKYSLVPFGVMGHAEPIVIYTLILEGMYAKAHPENQKTGVPMDLFFQQEATKHGIPVKGFEEASDQEQALDSIPIKEQTDELIDLVEHPESVAKEMDEMLADYRVGKISEILSNTTFGSFSPGEMSSLLYDRNQRWLNQLQNLLPHHNLFIAVGAGHLAGVHGLVKGLHWLGYKVEWVNAE